jgi:dCTP deaminase
MTIKPDIWIARMAVEHSMIDPFVDNQIRQAEDRRVISYGVSSYGYDLRAAPEFQIFTNTHCAEVDPKDFDPHAMVEAILHEDGHGLFTRIPPNSFALARSLEYIRMPRNVTGIVLCKSTYIRAGILIPTTVLEAGWEGHVTFEVANVTPLPARVYANEGLVQVLFFEGEQPHVAYGERTGGGKYQGQRGITLPKV